MTSVSQNGFLTGAPLDLPAIPVRELPLPTRAKNALLRGGIATLADMSEWRVSELLTLPHCGPATVDALRQLIGDLAGARSPRRARARWRRRPSSEQGSEAGRQHAR